MHMRCRHQGLDSLETTGDAYRISQNSLHEGQEAGALTHISWLGTKVVQCPALWTTPGPSATLSSHWAAPADAAGMRCGARGRDLGHRKQLQPPTLRVQPLTSLQCSKLTALHTS